MGLKLLIAVACTIAGEEISRHAAVGETVDTTKDDAATLTRLGRAYYLDRDDDPTKGQLTATSDIKKAVAEQAKAFKAAEDQRAIVSQAQSPAGMAELIAASVASAVQAALQATPAVESKPAGA